MMSPTNLGNAMTIINNTARSLAQNEALVAWAETRRLVLNAMKPNKQSHIFSRLVLNAMKPNKPFRKHQISSILLVVVMCWASQCSAQPTRANQPQQTIMVSVAQNQQGQQAFAVKRKIGVCHLINNLPDNEPSAENSLGVVGAADDYLTKYEHKKSLYGKRKIEGVGLVPVILGTSTTHALQQPSHGRLILDTYISKYTSEKSEDFYSYIPEDGYFGKDRAVFLVDINGQKALVGWVEV